MDKLWPSCMSSAHSSNEEFWSHEWAKHGKCANHTEHDYFAKGLALAQQVRGKCAQSAHDCHFCFDRYTYALMACKGEGPSPSPGPAPGPGPSPSGGRCYPNERGPACSGDDDCAGVKDCVRCAHSGYCTSQPYAVRANVTSAKAAVASPPAWAAAGASNGCSAVGKCGRAYQACCAGFAAKGFPCQCHLANGDGEAGKCGDCGTGFAACCIGFAAKGHVTLAGVRIIRRQGSRMVLTRTSPRVCLPQVSLQVRRRVALQAGEYPGRASLLRNYYTIDRLDL